MSNMSYCRFENTLRDLEDCLEHIHDSLEDSSTEKQCRKELIDICKQIAEEYPEDDE